MEFHPYIAIEIPRRDNGLIASDNDTLSEFWGYVDESIESGLSCAVGCYIFAIRSGEDALPWYVGKAEKYRFKEACFSLSKLNLYNYTMFEREGTPFLKMIPKFTREGHFSQPTKIGHKDIELLEKMLITWSIQRNPELKATKYAQILRETVVPGLLNHPSGREGADIQELKHLLGV